MSAKNVLVYADKGASTRLVVTTMHALQRNLHSVNVRTIMAQDVLDGAWKADSVMLVMPGGADLPYCEALNGQGNQQIRDFVKQGGAYLGLCAGAYYASKYVCFGRGTPLHVEGGRELGFFPGIAFGSVAPAFDYSSEAGAQMVLHRVARESSSLCMIISKRCASSSSMPPEFKATSVTVCAPLSRNPPCPAETSSNDDVASRSSSNAADNQAGGFEVSSAVLQEDIWLEGSSARAQAQQAACFLTDRSAQQRVGSSARALTDLEASASDGPDAPVITSERIKSTDEQGNISVEAVTPVAGPIAELEVVSDSVGETQKQSDAVADNSLQKQCFEHSEDAVTSEREPGSSRPLTQGSSFADYVNGGCCFLPDRGFNREGEHVRVIARYKEINRIAAVATRPFGEHSGHVVLCGTHPEMPGQLLLPAMHLEPPGTRFKGEGAQLYRQHLAQLHRELLGSSGTSSDNESRRELYFRLLLQHAGMGDLLTNCSPSQMNTVVEV